MSINVETESEPTESTTQSTTSDDSPKKRKKVRSIFISDVHLGSRFCEAEELLSFLKSYDCDYLYLVGDIIDGWKMRKGVYWTDTYNRIVRRIIGMMNHGTKVFYVAGNHDEFLRSFLPNEFGHLKVADEFIHETADGRQLLIIHGDMFDQITVKAKWLYFLGDKSYSFAMWLNAQCNRIRRWFKLPYWSLSLRLKRNVKSAINFINEFENYLVLYTRDKECVGTVCGHIHAPAIKEIDGITYYNCGDWVESCSALVEDFDGNITLLDF